MSEPTTTRRNALRTIAATVGVTTVGAGALYGIDEAMGAHVTGSYDFTDPTALVNDTGDLKWVRVIASTDINWTGFEVSVEYVGFTEVVEVYDANDDRIAGPHIYWGQEVAGGDGLTQTDHPRGFASAGNVGNDSGPYELDSDREDHQAGTTGFIDSGGTNYQVLIAEGGDGSPAETDARDGSAIDTVPLDADDAFEPAADGETLTTTVRKTEFAHLYTDVEGSPDLIHPLNGYDWAPGPAVVSGTFDVTVENIPSSTEDSTGSGDGESG